jgi:hypothetical protein
MLAFVPFVPSPPPSPQAEELGQRLAEVIEQYRQQHPDLGRAEVLQATRLALARSGGEPAAARSALVVAIGVSALFGVFAALAANGGRCPASAPVLMIGVAVAVVLVLLVIKRR